MIRGVILKILLLTFKALNDLAPTYIADLLTLTLPGWRRLF